MTFTTHISGIAERLPEYLMDFFRAKISRLKRWFKKKRQRKRASHQNTRQPPVQDDDSLAETANNPESGYNCPEDLPLIRSRPLPPLPTPSSSPGQVDSPAKIHVVITDHLNEPWTSFYLSTALLRHFSVRCRAKFPPEMDSDQWKYRWSTRNASLATFRLVEQWLLNGELQIDPNGAGLSKIKPKALISLYKFAEQWEAPALQNAVINVLLSQLLPKPSLAVPYAVHLKLTAKENERLAKLVNEIVVHGLSKQQFLEHKKTKKLSLEYQEKTLAEMKGAEAQAERWEDWKRGLEGPGRCKWHIHEEGAAGAKEKECRRAYKKGKRRGSSRSFKKLRAQGTGADSSGEDEAEEKSKGHTGRCRATFSTPPVTVHVGEPPRTFTIPSGLLTHSSRYFLAALRNNWREAEAQSVALPEDSPTIFEIYDTWLYTRRLFDPEPFTSRYMVILTWDELVASYAFAQMRGCMGFGNAVIDACITKMTTEAGYPFYIVRFVYRNTEKGCGLRRLLADAAVATIGEAMVQKIAASGDSEKYPWEYVVDLLSAFAPSGPRKLKWADLEGIDRCQYHEHPNLDKNTRRNSGTDVEDSAGSHERKQSGGAEAGQAGSSSSDSAGSRIVIPSDEEMLDGVGLDERVFLS
ncbi:MAG: hypothetical protein M1820_005150 [Bogoriella megaspora]|nr:MAG: hypothetical protein M1820_005150 [Bogoriella megaspora]